jgi:hypothetical protein
MFDNKTIEHLGHYVYVLIHPESNAPFYIGMGSSNRVFDHKNDALRTRDESLKLDTIRKIKDLGLEVNHIIVRHGLNRKEALEVEASLIDFGNYLGFDLSNLASGHHVESKGLMTSDEIIRLHNAQPLYELHHSAIIININKNYFRGNSSDAIYQATKQSWVIAAHRRNTIKYALAEYSGIIIEVFEIEDWYSIHVPNKKRQNRWGFNGKIAPDVVRDLYINKTIAHTKKRGAANPIKYRL